MQVKCVNSVCGCLLLFAPWLTSQLIILHRREGAAIFLQQTLPFEKLWYSVNCETTHCKTQKNMADSLL